MPSNHIPHNQALKGVLLGAGATFFLALRGIFVKLAYAENISVTDLIYLRFFFTMPFLWGLAFLVAKHDIKKMLKKEIILPCIAAGFFGYYIATLFDFYSLSYMDASLNRIILYTFPIYLVLISALLERRMPKLSYILAIILVEICVIIILGGVADMSSQKNLKLGVIFILISAFSYVFYLLINQASGKKIGAVLFTTFALTASFLFVNLHFLIFGLELHLSAISLKGYSIILIIAVFCTFLPLVMVSASIRLIGAERSSIIALSGPVITTIAAVLFLGEKITLIQVLAGLAIIVILYWVERRQIKAKSK